LSYRDYLHAIARYVRMDEEAGVEEGFDPHGLFVFCHEDPRIAEAVHDHFIDFNPSWILLTGGIGKGSGPRSRAAGSEARHQYNLATRCYALPSCIIHLETQARNGAENSRLGIDQIKSLELAHDRMILLVPPRAARRVVTVHKRIAFQEKSFDAEYRVLVTEDKFEPDNPAHAKEVCDELIRLADWPAKGWSDPLPDLPDELVKWARGYLSQTA
jgi:hypothetical protein